MSFLIGPILDATVRVAITSVGTVVYYTGSGIWWLGKRAIWGRQPTAEERLEQKLEEQKLVLERLEARLDGAGDE